MAGDGGVGVRGGVELEVLLRVVVGGLGLRRGLGVVGHGGRWEGGRRVGKVGVTSL